jgi:hypothetical protein
VLLLYVGFVFLQLRAGWQRCFFAAKQLVPGCYVPALYRAKSLFRAVEGGLWCGNVANVSL